MSFAITDVFGMLSLTSTTEITLSLDPRYQYKFTHTGIDAAGNGDASSQLSAWLSTLSATITCDKTVEDEKYELANGANETFGPGIDTLYLKSTAVADGVIKFVRIGTPTVSY
jgi:hypothetical protein